MEKQKWLLIKNVVNASGRRLNLAGKDAIGSHDIKLNRENNDFTCLYKL